MSETGSRSIGHLDVPYGHLIDNPFDRDSVEYGRRLFYLEKPTAVAIEKRQKEIDDTTEVLEAAEINLQVQTEAARQAIQEAREAESTCGSLAAQLETLRHSPIATD